jgi:ABC-type multidrug transport system fused ATPase/permease subunit
MLFKFVQLYEAAYLSNCLEFIQAFPNGFDTLVGEHGSSMLSGGFTNK